MCLPRQWLWERGTAPSPQAGRGEAIAPEANCDKLKNTKNFFRCGVSARGDKQGRDVPASISERHKPHRAPAPTLRAQPFQESGGKAGADPRKENVPALQGLSSCSSSAHHSAAGSRMEAEMSREEKSRAAGSSLREREKKMCCCLLCRARGRGWMRPGWLGSSEKRRWHGVTAGWGEAGDAGQRGEFIAPITQAGIFKAALGTRTLDSHSFLLGIPNPPGCFENPSLTSRVTGRSQPPLHLCHADNPTASAAGLTRSPSSKAAARGFHVEHIQLSHPARDLPPWAAKGT